MICGFALAWVTIGCIMTLAFVIIGCIKIGVEWSIQEWIQEEEIEMADPNLWLEQGDVEWNPINRQMNHQIENFDGSGDK